MLKHIRHLLCLLAVLPMVMGCSDDVYSSESDDWSGEIPVELDIHYPSTRKFGENDKVKTSFQGGDIIHVLGEFKTRSLTEEGDSIYGTLSRYGAFRYNQDKRSWEAVGDENSQKGKLTWPTIATEGTFTAYFVAGSDGTLTNSPMGAQLLSDITPATDPLEATSGTTPIPYGYAVPLNFTHKCANLTLIELEPMVAESYFFTCEKKENFHNAFQLSLGKDNNDQQTLNFTFLRVPDSKSHDVYISSKVAEMEDENGKTIAKANYFLEPGYYDTFSLFYPAGDNTIRYLDYDYNKIPEGVGGQANTRPDLQANTTYTLTISKSPGVTIISPPSADGWDENGDGVKVDVEEFLKAVCNQQDYYYEENDINTQILEKTANGTRLLHNVDFQHFDYADFEDKEFLPDLKAGLVFDGNHHYIQNLGSSLFYKNYGTIQNLGIENIEIFAISYTAGENNRHGALCMYNRSESATINNIRVKNVEMKVSIQSEIVVGEDGKETHNIGCVIGSNDGTVSEVALGGKFELIVEGKQEDKYKEHVNASVLIGGFVGQNAGTGKIHDVSPLDNEQTITIINKCIGEIGSYSVGGMVGESLGIIADVILADVKIDGSESQGITSYMGGIAGQLNVSEDLSETADLRSCIVSGSVKTGSIHLPPPSLSAASYVGGLVGADLKVPVSDSRAAISIDASAEVVEGGTYAIGGAFGRIREAASDYKFKDIIAYGSLLKGPSNAAESGIDSYVGNFAGIVPAGHTWDDNYAGNGITVRQFSGLQNIGAAQ